MDSHTFSTPTLVEDTTKDIQPRTWKVDVIRCGSNRAVVGTLYINNTTLPPRYNKKGKMAWKLPMDSKETPKFGPPEQRRLWELHKQQKKERRKQQNNTNKNGSTNGETTSTTSSSEADNTIKTKQEQQGELKSTDKDETKNQTTLANGSRPLQQQIPLPNTPAPPPPSLISDTPTPPPQAQEEVGGANPTTTQQPAAPQLPPPPPGFTTAPTAPTAPSPLLDTSTLPLRSFPPPPPLSSPPLLHEWALAQVLPHRNNSTPDVWPLYYRATAPLTFLVHSAQAVACTRTERHAAAANFRDWTVQGWTIAELLPQQQMYQLVMTGTTVSVSQGGQWMVFTSTIVLVQEEEEEDGGGGGGYVIDRDVTTLFAV